MRWTRDFRLIPLVLLATVCLFALKVSGLVFDGGYTLGQRLAGENRTELTPTTRDSIPDVTPIIRAGDAPPPQQQSWAKEMFNYGGDVTGSVGASKPPAKPEAAKDAKDSKDGKEAKDAKDGKEGKDPKTAKVVNPPPDPGGTLVPTGPQGILPAGERAILERLQERRQQLEARNRELEMREGLLQAAEKRLEAKLTEIKAIESRINATVQKRDQEEAKHFKGIVTMYENMKAKEAARIFDRLDLKILVEVSTQINPRKMSEILAQMTPEAAERLTVEIANRAASEKTQSAEALPQIEGRPNPR
jgi:flagellar motility protein MotE (MotC chaperone)